MLGPVLPSDMIWQRSFVSLMPTFMTASIPPQLQFGLEDIHSPLKRSWSTAFENMVLFQWPKLQQTDSFLALPPPTEPVARKLSFEEVVSDDCHVSLQPLVPVLASINFTSSGK